MAMLGRKPLNLNAYVPPVNIDAAPIGGTPLASPDVPTLTKPPGFFGQGGVGRSIAGAIGDFLLQMNRMQPIYAPARAEQTAFERGDEQYQRRRKDNLADQMTLLAYKDAHPNDELTQYMTAAGIDPTSEAGKALYLQKAQAMTAPPMMSAQGVDEQGNPVMRFFPRATPLPQVIPALPPGAVPIGGQTPPASGNFPRR